MSRQVQDGGAPLAAWLGVVFVWSTTPLTIKWSAMDLGPWAAVAGRTAIGALVFLLLFASPLQRFEHSARVWRLGAIVAAFFVAGMLLMYAGAPLIPSGLMSVVYGLSPIVTALLASMVFRDERLTAAKAAGCLLGFGGIALIFGAGLDPAAGLGPGAALGLLLNVLSMAVNCTSMLVVKRMARDIPVASLTAASVWLGLPAFVLVWWALDGRIPDAVPDRALWSVLWLGVMGNVLGFLLFYYALKHLPASQVALITLVTPLLALGVGATFNGEQLPTGAWTGSVLVLTGVAIAVLGDRRLASG